MPASTSKKTVQMSGTIHHLDLLNRELELIVSMRRTCVDVPPDCLVLLRGEPVKLRMLQPGDYINVALHVCAGAKVAREIEVHGNQPSAPASN